MQEASFQTHRCKYLPPFEEGHILLLSYSSAFTIWLLGLTSIESNAHAITVTSVVRVAVAVVVHVSKVRAGPCAHNRT